MTQLAAQGAVYIHTLMVDDLKTVIYHQFKSKDYEKKGIKNQNCNSLIQGFMRNIYKHHHQH